MWQRFEIKRHKPKSENATIDKQKEIGLLIHRKLAEALNLYTHLKENLSTNYSKLEIPTPLEID